MAIVINGSGTLSGLAVGGLPDGTVDAGTLATDSVVTGKIADGTITNADMATKPVEATSVTNTAGQNWSGVTYTDPNAVGANPTAKIYPDGSVVGSTDNGDYTKYPNGDLVCIRTITSNSGADVTWNFPVQFNAVPVFTGMSVGDPSRYVTTAGAYTSSTLDFRAWIAGTHNRSSTSCRLQTRGRWG